MSCSDKVILTSCFEKEAGRTHVFATDDWATDSGIGFCDLHIALHIYAKNTLCGFLKMNCIDVRDIL
jgi:hypothetical protein